MVVCTCAGASSGGDERVDTPRHCRCGSSEECLCCERKWASLLNSLFPLTFPSCMLISTAVDTTRSKSPAVMRQQECFAIKRGIDGDLDAVRKVTDNMRAHLFFMRNCCYIRALSLSVSLSPSLCVVRRLTSLLVLCVKRCMYPICFY